MVDMDDLTMWSLIVGFMLPLLISVVQQPRWSDAVRAVVTAVICLIVGGGTAYFAADLTGRTWVSSALIVMVSAITVYRNFWKQTGVTEKIESATAPGGSTP